MKIAYIADATSPIARNWIAYFIQQGHEVHVISSYPCSPDSLPAASIHAVPIAFSSIAASRKTQPAAGSRGLFSGVMAYLRYGPAVRIKTLLRYGLGSLEIYRHVRRVRAIVEEIQPDLVHAMRLPFEGILASLAVRQTPLLISVWGNDFTLFAKQYPLIGLSTLRSMRRADAILCDCVRDLKLAATWGFDSRKPSAILAGGGGVQPEIFYPGEVDPAARAELHVPDVAPVVINPRGFRDYVRSDVFFQAMPLVLRRHPQTIFLCLSMEGNPVALQWIERLNIADSVRLLPTVPRERMGDLFRMAAVAVSPSLHDGTPNTLLETMACGCFPVAGDIEPVREWITDGVNGLLCDPTNPDALAQAIIRALDSTDLRDGAAAANVTTIAQRAGYTGVMAQAEQFCRRVSGAL